MTSYCAERNGIVLYRVRTRKNDSSLRNNWQICGRIMWKDTVDIHIWEKWTIIIFPWLIHTYDENRDIKRDETLIFMDTQNFEMTKWRAISYVTDPDAGWFYREYVLQVQDADFVTEVLVIIQRMNSSLDDFKWHDTSQESCTLIKFISINFRKYDPYFFYECEIEDIFRTHGGIKSHIVSTSYKICFFIIFRKNRVRLDVPHVYSITKGTARIVRHSPIKSLHSVSIENYGSIFFNYRSQSWFLVFDMIKNRR